MHTTKVCVGIYATERVCRKQNTSLCQIHFSMHPSATATTAARPPVTTVVLAAGILEGVETAQEAAARATSFAQPRPPRHKFRVSIFALLFQRHLCLLPPTGTQNVGKHEENEEEEEGAHRGSD